MRKRKSMDIKPYRYFSFTGMIIYDTDDLQTVKKECRSKGGCVVDIRTDKCVGGSKRDYGSLITLKEMYESNGEDGSKVFGRKDMVYGL